MRKPSLVLPRVLLGTLLACSLLLGACAKPATTGNDVQDSQQNPDAGTDQTSQDDGWELVPAAASLLTDEQEELFFKAKEGLLGADYDPVAVLATQVVSGTNYAYLCKGSLTVPEAGDGWYVIRVYESLEGAAELQSIQEMDVSQLRVAPEAPAGSLLGGWQVYDQQASAVLPTGLDELFSSEGQQQSEVKLTPIAVLAEQDADASSYLVLCEGEASGDDAMLTLYVATATLTDGVASLASVDQLEFLSYVSPTA